MVHWTERSTEDFLYSIASDFIEQLQAKMKLGSGWNQSRLAKAAKLSKSRISQVFNDPGNLELGTVVKLARALNMKVSVIAYEDTDDPKNERGPINADIFRMCWEKANKPVDMWSFEVKQVQQTTPALDLQGLQDKLDWGLGVYYYRMAGSNALRNQTGNKVIKSLPDTYSLKNIQKASPSLSKLIQGSEVWQNG